MSHPIMKAAALLVFTTLSAFALADDAPARVGRIAVTQGQVGIGGDVGAELSPAQVNWPVTTGSLLNTAANARTEVQVGSTSIRLDGDSSLEVLQLDDDTMRLRLHYGSASIRIVNPDVLAGFELETPQARVRLDQPGRLRVDAERVRDTSFVTVFDGVALVEAGGSQLTVRAGRRAELGDVDVRTLGAVRDNFDEWAASRDRIQDGATSARYVTTEMTGYEDLDRYGSWNSNEEYGPLWYPTVAASWVPYRDGSWTWLDPWGWTWVDNAPWGYAPFHYGRWVQVRNRWAWAPGRRGSGPRPDRPVWAPALVGWVGGAGWDVAFRDRGRRPASGWYPLTPHDRFVPGWNASASHSAWLNAQVRPDPRRPRDYRPPGLTVVPRDQFGRPGRIDVPRAPLATVPPALAHNAPAGAPPAPPNRPQRPGRGDWDRDPQRGGGRIETDRGERDGFVGRPRPGQVAQAGGTGLAPGLVTPAQPTRPQPVTSPTPHLPPQPLSTVTSPPPRQSPQPLMGTTPTPQRGVPEQYPAQNRPERIERNDRNDRDDRRERMEEWRRNRPTPVQGMQPSMPAQAAQPAPRIERPEPRIERQDRPNRGDGGGGPQRNAPAAMPAAPPAPAAPQQARGGGEEKRQHTDNRGRNQQER
jgi:hypothetical protein